MAEKEDIINAKRYHGNSFLNRVFVYNLTRKGSRSLKGKRSTVLLALRNGSLRHLQDTIFLMNALGVEYSVDRLMGVIIVASNGCPDIIHGPDEAYIGKDFGSRKRRTSQSREQSQLFCVSVPDSTRGTGQQDPADDHVLRAPPICYE